MDWVKVGWMKQEQLVDYKELLVDSREFCWEYPRPEDYGSP
jgi:hypothetical protein